MNRRNVAEFAKNFGREPLKPKILAISATVLLGSITACAPYRFGSAAIFPPNVRTVHVPIAGNTTFRHDIGIRLTEAVIREIERRTPMKVVGDALTADSVLTIEVIGETKNVLTETDTDFARALDIATQTRATWTDRTGALLMNGSVVPTVDNAILFSDEKRFVPEAGQSVEMAIQEAVQDIASQIVDQMEVRW